MSERVRQSGAAGSKTFSGSDSRRYNYFDPQGRRATLYEDVTVDVQPDPSRYLIQDWILSFADGKPSYHEGTTAMQCSDWHVYRAPDQEWERTHFQRQSRIENTIKTVVDSARGSGAPARFDPSWVSVLQDHFGALKHAEFGLGVALTKAQRDGVTQMINNTILTNSSYKLRLAQDITLYLGDLGLDIDIDGDAGKKCWLETPRLAGGSQGGRGHPRGHRSHRGVLWRPTSCSRPWSETSFAAVSSRAPARCAMISSRPRSSRLRSRTISATSQTPWHCLLLLVNDAQYGDANKKVIANWLETYVPLCVDAANKSVSCGICRKRRPSNSKTPMGKRRNGCTESCRSWT